MSAEGAKSSAATNRLTGYGSSLAHPPAASRVRDAAAVDGTWLAVPPPSARAGHTAIVDAARNRIILFGGFDGAYRNDVWVLPLQGPERWSPMAISGPGPSARSDHRAIYDPVRDRMIVFGGTDPGAYLNDVWALSLSGTPFWTRLEPTGPRPSPRVGHTAIYDPPRDRMIVFAGDDGGIEALDDCWSLDLSGTPSWSALHASGTTPPPRAWHTAVYDAASERMIVFGGDDGTTRFDDVLALSLGAGPAWTALSPAGEAPPARSGHTAVHDTERDRMIVFGGFDGAFRLDDAHALSLGATPTWSNVGASGAPPSARRRHAAILDEVGARMIVVGGDDGSLRNDGHSLSLAAAPGWSPIVPAGAGPSARYRQSAVTDPVRQRMVVFGGYDGGYPYSSEILSLSLTDSLEWNPLVAGGGAPAGRYGHTAIYDPLRDRMIVFGGHDGASRVNEVWALSFSPAPAWALLAPSGTPPSPRQNHAAIYDPVQDRMIVFGGFDGARRNDTWGLSLSDPPAWTSLAPSGPLPSARSNHTAIYDPSRERMVLFGGSDGSFRNDVWALSLSGPLAWSAITPAGTPPSSRTGHCAIYDPIRDRMVIFGGDDLTYRDDTWSLSLGTSPVWSLLSTTGTVPPGRRFHSGIYDPWEDRLVVFGGWNDAYRGDAALLEWGEPIRPVVTCPGDSDAEPGETLVLDYLVENPLPQARVIECALRSASGWPAFPVRARTIAGAYGSVTVSMTVSVPDTATGGTETLVFEASFAGADGNEGACGHTLVISGAPAGVGSPDTAGFAFDGIRPNPVASDGVITFTIPSAGRVIIEVFDASGRRVGARREMTCSSGRHDVPVSALGARTTGVYFLRLTFGSQSLQQRVVIVR